MSTNGQVTVGFPRMHCEPNERRDFLPPLIGLLAATGTRQHPGTRGHRRRPVKARHRDLWHRCSSNEPGGPRDDRHRH